MNAHSGSLIGFFTPQEGGEAFVNLMGAVFVAGLIIASWGGYQFVKALKAAVDAFRTNEARCASEDPLTFLRRQARPEATARWIDPIPSILITIGILGTFMGIGMAVQSAIPALESSSSESPPIAALANLLKAVQFKFANSAWGILFSLAFTGVRVGVESWMMRRIETDAHSLQKFRKYPEDRIALAIGNSFDKLAARLEGSLTCLERAAGILGDGSQRLSEAVGQLQEHVGLLGRNVEGSARQLASASKDLGTVGDKIDQSLRRVSKELVSGIDKSNWLLVDSATKQANLLEAGLVELRGTLERNLKSFESTLGSRLASFESIARTAADAQTKAASHSQKSIEDSLGSMSGKLDNAITKQAKAVEETGRATRDALDALKRDLNQSLGDLNEYQAKATSAIQGLDKSMAKFDIHMTSILDLIGRLKGEAAVEKLRGSASKLSEPQTPPTGKPGAKPTKAADDFF